MPSAGICPVCGKNQPNGVHKHAAGRGRYVSVKNVGPAPLEGTMLGAPPMRPTSAPRKKGR